MKHDFHFISRKDPEVKKVYTDLQNMFKEVQSLLRKKFTFRFDVVGSYKVHMITQDTKSNVGFDFDFNFEVNHSSNRYLPKELKNIFQKTIGEVCTKYGYDYPEDSTRVLTIKVKNRKKSCIIHSCDIAIVSNYTDNKGNKSQKYIHYDKAHGNYIWCEQPQGYYRLPDKIDWIKKNGLWNDMRKLYIDKKNKNDNPNVHSRSIFSITVHEICQKSGYYKKIKDKKIAAT